MRRALRPTVTRVGSGIIYAVIIVMWAAYFIPRWLKRHEELSESRSVEKFDHAMRILLPQGRHPRPAPGRHAPPAAPQRTLPARTPLPTQRTATVRRTRRPTSASVRRRRILAGLLLSTFVATLLTPVTPVPWWVPVALLVVTVADIVHLRAQVRSSREVSRSREAVRRSMRSRLTRFDALDRLMSVRRELAEERAAENARWAAAEEAERLVREEEEREAADEAWRLGPGPGAAPDVRQQAAGSAPGATDRPHPSGRLE